MTKNQYNQLLSEPWKFEDREMTFYIYNPHTGRKDKKKGIFRGFSPVFMPDGTVVVDRIHIGYFGQGLGIHFSDVVLPRLTSPFYL